MSLATQLTYRNLVKAVEVWEPSTDGTHLVWSSGTYGELDRLESMSRETTFRLGEGLPGLIWQTQSPLIMHSLSAGTFVRAAEARDAGLDCGIGIPFFCGNTLRGILAFLCDAGDKVQGAFEVWRLNDRHELGLDTSYYANLEHFGRLSHFVKFPRGAGLPGQTWQMRFPRLLDSLAESPSFMRAAGARVDGLEVGLALPIMRSPWDLDSVVVMLSSRFTPLARVFEIWMRDESGDFTLHSGSFGPFDALRAATTSLRLPDSSGLLGRAASTGRPFVETDAPSVEVQRRDLLSQAELATAVCMPIHIGAHLVAVVNLFL